MAREIETDRSAMLDGVMAIIEKDGWEGVSARSVAAKLGISTQPLYREFGDMEGLKTAATVRGFEMFSEYLGSDALEQASKYVMFACERGKLFNFLFRNRHNAFSGLTELSHNLLQSTGIIDKLSKITGLTGEDVYSLHLKLWMTLHGLACFAVDNGGSVTADEVKKLTAEMTHALTDYIKRRDK